MTRARLFAVFIAGSAWLAAPALGEDPRLVERVYSPTAVVRLEGKPNVQTTIKFADDEHIENVAIGDSMAWQVTPNKRANLLFVKPLSARAATNMTVVTDRRTYMFDLVATPSSKVPLYVLAFSYADAPAEAQPPGRVRADEPSHETGLAAGGKADGLVDPADLNFAWTSTGKRKLLPAKIYDDGAATYLTWPAGAPVPAILIKDHEGREGPVNFAVRGHMIVVDGVPRQLVLRAGQDSATLSNDGPVERHSASELARAASGPAEVN